MLIVALARLRVPVEGPRCLLVPEQPLELVDRDPSENNQVA
jgi:hypothetical protein